MKKSRITYFLVVAIMLAVPTAASGYDFKVDDVYYSINNDSTTVTVISCTYWMESLTIPSTVDINGVSYRVTDIGTWAFTNDRHLRYVDVGDGVERIGLGAFSQSDIDSISIGKSVSYIGSDAFLYCHRMKKVLIKDLAAWCNIDFDKNGSNPLINEYTHLFVNGEEINDLVIPKTVTEIKTNAFMGGQFTSVTIPEGVTHIGAYAFYGCTINSPLVLPNSLTTIEERAFGACSDLPEVYLGRNIVTIGGWVFSSCPLLTNVICSAITPPIITDGLLNMNYYAQATLHVPLVSLEAYKSALYWKDFNEIIGDVVIDIPGDVNGDGEINIADVNAVIHLILMN